MPFGMENAPSVFQRFITRILRSFIDDGSIIIVYIDDIDSYNRIGGAFAYFETSIATIEFEEVSVLLSGVEYLGYLVDSRGIRPSQRHVENIKSYPLPRNAKEVQSCLGLFSYFRRFVPNFSRIAMPLLYLVRECPFQMTAR